MLSQALIINKRYGMTKLSLAGALTAAVIAAAPAFADNVTIETATGPVEVASSPEKVAAFDIAAIDTLSALGVAPAGVPDKLYVGYLADLADNAQPVGTLFEPDLEALAGLAPDLIVVGGRSAKQVAALSPVAPTIDMTIGTDLIEDAKARLTAYGQLFGTQEKAAELADNLQSKLDGLQAAAKDQGKALIVMTNGPKVSAYGAGSRFGWMHSAVGIPEAHENLDPETHGDAISFEFIAETNPDWLFVIDRGAAIGEEGSAKATLDNPLVAGTTAGKKGQIVYLSSAPLYIAGGGYQSLTGTMDELLAAMAASK